MTHPKDDPVVICGMTEAAAKRYIVVRQEVLVIIDRLHKAGYYLNQFDEIRPTGIGYTLALMGRSIMHDTVLIDYYLENEFASLEKVYEAVYGLKK